MRIGLDVKESPQGVVVYRGPSQINGKPIVAVVTGLKQVSENGKTGQVVQVYILRDGVHPIEALRTGEDDAVCGDCYHRRVGGAGTCYVNIVHGPNGVYNAHERDRYPMMSPEDAARLLAGKTVRLGAYGDPAAVPLVVWTALLSKADGWTGYTHQWRKPFAKGLNRFCMASVETERAMRHAQRKGWRTFRIRDTNDPTLPREIVCPASKEGGQRLTCGTCGACNGGRPDKASIVIIAHGPNWKRQRLTKLLRALKGKKRLVCN